jgi:hypothetical protein
MARAVPAICFLLVLAACDGDGGGDAVDGPGDPTGDGGPGGSDGGPPAGGEVVYPSDRTHSPITAALAEHLRGEAARAPDQAGDVFAKLGDSHTVSTDFLACFAGGPVDLDGRTALEPTLDAFLAGDAAGTTPYQRESAAAELGWSASSVLAGDPSPLETELAALHPRFALVMFGTNDLGRMDLDRYGGDLLDIADQLLASGVIPIYSTIPPRGDDSSAQARVPLYNAVVRAVAQGRRFPLVDLYRELLGIQGWGLAGDGIHLDVDPAGACVFSAAALGHGHNVRNLRTLEALDRAAQVVLNGASAPDAIAPIRLGTGTAADPIVVDALPFADLRDTRAGARGIAAYPGCAASQDESGPEIDYRFEVTQPITIRAAIVDRGDVDVDLHLTGDPASGGACLSRHDRELTAILEPGTYHLIVDSFVGSGTEHAGEYLLVVTE